MTDTAPIEPRAADDTSAAVAEAAATATDREGSGAGPRAPRTSGKAVLGAFAVAVGGILLLVPLLPASLGVFGMIAGWISRRELRADPGLAGAGLSAFAFFGGAVLIAVVVLPWLVPALLLFLAP
ncbi:hypothetical protein ABIQ69_10855 [Agromyces sp. G08B096]|uniref:DUF4190 domain-containing protein n=1 Tax=Agromyces sp. G08B096 TaxID=3156399 RepID=A0AAU7W449_9MICO